MKRSDTIYCIEAYEQWKRGRRRFFAQAGAAAERAGLAPHEAQALADQAVQAVRAASHPRSSSLIPSTIHTPPQERKHP